MSIYSLCNRLTDLTFKSFTLPFFPEVIAYKKDGTPYLYKKDYDVKVINNLDNDYIIEYGFFDYRYHDFEMLSLDFRNNLKKKITVVVEHLEAASYGYFINYIIFHEILVNIYSLEKEDFIIYLDGLNIYRKSILDIYLEYNYKLPFSENYLIFLKRILKHREEKILDIVFNSRNHNDNFKNTEISTMLDNFDYGNINDAYLKIVNNISYSQKEKLIYLQILLENYKYTIDQESIIYFSVKKSRKILGYYLYTMDVDENLINIYRNILKIFLEKGGVKKLTIVDNNDIKNKIESLSIGFI